jgi:AcrR family transcriptional regulator
MATTDDEAPPRGRGKLSREAIVSAAIAVIDEAGLEGLTMRRLGAALGVDAMAVYGYFENKSALLDAIVDHEATRLASIEGPFPTDGIEAMLHIARHYRRVLLDHPNLAPVVASRPLPQQEAPSIVQFGVRLFQHAGFERFDIPLATDAIVTFVLGFVLQEAGRTQRREQLGDEFHEQQQSLRARLAELPGDTSLADAVVVRRLRDDATLEEFEVGMRAMLHGLRLGLGRPPEGGA